MELCQAKIFIASPVWRSWYKVLLIYCNVIILSVYISGVGKTTVLKELSKMCKLANMLLISSAATVTGVAAGQMHEAGTNHSRYELPVYARNELNIDGFLPPLSQMTIHNLLE
jgi:hypothetical protein